jgi:hypothetical protein
MFLILSSTKLENRRAEQVLPGSGRMFGTNGRWGGGRERDRRMKMVQIIYTQVCKCKNDTC